jgi:hypothetical protein
MFRRTLGALLLFTALATSATLVYAGTDNGNGNGGQNSGNQYGKDKDPSGAPELDPSFLGSGTLLLAGGTILLNESRRRRRD